MQYLYLMRHAQSVANASRIVAGSHESPLSEVGGQQAAFAGETIKQYFPIDLIVSSPMTRALQTAEIIARQLDYSASSILVLQELRERNLGDVEGKDYRHAPQHNGNYEDAENVPNVEPLQHLYDRVKHALEQLRERPERHILIICHNGCGRMLKTVLRGEAPIKLYDQPRLENAIVYSLPSHIDRL